MSGDLLRDLRHFENGGTVENPKALIRDAIARIEKLQSAAKTLGKIIDDSLMDVARATDSLDLLDEYRDGDWMLIFERLAELRPARDAALADVERMRVREANLRSIGERLCDMEGQRVANWNAVLGREILAALDAEVPA